MSWAVSIFWGAAALIVYTYLGYPAWVFIRSCVWPRPWLRKESIPTVSVVMAVHNGGELVSDTINHLLSLDYPHDLLEIIVVSDGSSDQTNVLLQAASDQRLRVLICDDHRGKAAALNLGIRNAHGEILLFIDLRPRLQAGALRSLLSNFADPEVGCAAGKLILVREDHDATSAAIGDLYWSYEQWLRVCESIIDSPCGVYGGFYAVRRSLAVEFPEGLILDDVYQPLQVVRQGYRCVIDREAEVCDTWPKTSGREFQRKVRTLAGNVQLLQLAPWLLTEENRLRFQIISHKLLRLFVPFALLACLLACIPLRHSAFYSDLLWAQGLFYFLALLGGVTDVPILSRVTGPASAFCLLNTAAVVALWKFAFMSEPLWRIWVPTENPTKVSARNLFTSTATPVSWNQSTSAVVTGTSVKQEKN
jgi:cellulose synthase/poly-beta-1,6-N-acetylglucosamine synthase-like glycosyltransferase